MSSRHPSRAALGLATTAMAAAGVAALGARDLLQRRHSILRIYPVVGHTRWALEAIRPEIQQYFIESSTDGRPFDRDTRTMIYQRAKGLGAEDAYGTQNDITGAGYDHILHASSPREPRRNPPRVRLGGPDCTRPYDTAMLNVSSMSFGSLSANAVLAMNLGAAMGGFAQETGEGGLTRYHLEHGADVIWEIGTGYFGCCTPGGRFDPEEFADKAAKPEVKGILIKLSQGAKPGVGGVLPAAKITPEIARARDVPQDRDCVSPAAHSAFSTPVEMMRFVSRLRELTDGKPIGLKFCVGDRSEVLSMCKGMLETGITPDWISVDGAEGGSGAAPLELEDHVGTPLTDGLVIVQNALVGTGLRDRVAIGCSGKIAGGNDIIRRVALGADFCSAARPMMMATGCIQAQRCNTNTCPSGVATQDPRRSRAVVVQDKGPRVMRYQRATVLSAMQLLAAMGLESFDDLGPRHVLRRIDPARVMTFEELYPWLEEGELLDGARDAAWAHDWEIAEAHRFRGARPAHQRHRRHRRDDDRAEAHPEEPQRGSLQDN
ncbi:FMN-binding glutamate synthase family protein [Brachybacterium endophyticum]|uniref:glutamate synthase (NADPH) n=1 Tax=Brachybacterium endophyticum TaxID=2182385 RepID=A0A2U2RI97_9MICO|nr:FMN-binding glutamate synthase family protein [Brachybacterium endophyticum]PWH05578.1 FMN-binding glutamate synthase family protein [Brachybacterium endophyticum]